MRDAVGVLRRLWRRPLARLGFAVFGMAVALALFAPWLSPADPMEQALERALSAPSAAHPLGTDRLGRDVLSRLLHGARISLSIALLAVGLSITIGSLLGAVAGLVGGWVDTVVMRSVDVVLAFPRLVLLLVVAGLFADSYLLLVLVLGLTQWPVTTRLVRTEVRGLRERDFVVAARALGFSRRRIVLRHLIPNALAPVLVTATLGVGDTIILEAGLSFLGVGLDPQVPSWGTMLAEGRQQMLGGWWVGVFPGVAIVGVVVALNLVGDALRDVLDPRLRGELR